MKFSITQEKLSKGLQTIYRAIPTKSTLPILSNVLIEAKDNNLILSATNLETAIKTNIGASVEEPGILAVPAKLLKEFVASLPSTTLIVDTKAATLNLKSDKTKTKFSGVNAEDYPQLPNVPKEGKYISINHKDLDKISQMVTFSAGNDSARPIFTGAYLKYTDKNLVVASTDGFRLSELTLKVEGTVDEMTVIVPAKTLAEIARIFSNTEENIKIYLNSSDNLLLFVSEDTLVATRILDGQYPDYKRIIPQDNILTATFSTEDFAEAVKVTNIFAKESNNTIKLSFDPEEHTIKVSSLAETTGENESVIQGNIEGEYLQLAFNSKYLLDYLNNVKSTNLVLKTNSTTAPCLITTDDHKDFIHIIMPLQV